MPPSAFPCDWNDNCCQNVKSFGLRYLRDLITVKIGKYSFTNLHAPVIPPRISELIERENRYCEIINCPRLESISIDVGSFFEFSEVRMECRFQRWVTSRFD